MTNKLGTVANKISKYKRAISALEKHGIYSLYG